MLKGRSLVGFVGKGCVFIGGLFLFAVEWVLKAGGLRRFTFWGGGGLMKLVGGERLDVFSRCWMSTQWVRFSQRTSSN